MSLIESKTITAVFNFLKIYTTIVKYTFCLMPHLWFRLKKRWF